MSGPHRYRVVTATALSALLLPLGTAGAVGATTVAAAGATSGSCTSVAAFEAARFPAVPRIDNRFLPLVPGTNFVLSGSVREDDGLLHPHTIVTTVTDLTKVIDGVRTLVVFDRDFGDGQLQESELAFEAQDGSGRVWNVGEYPEEYEKGRLAGAPSTWIAGIGGAVPGVGMLARPQPGTSSYLQGYSAAIDFFDCATVAKVHQHTCVPAGCFDDVLVTDEWAPLDPAGGHQLKYYAPGVGNVRVGAVGGTNAEVVDLRSVQVLSPAAFETVRQQVIAQDKRGYHVSKDVYRFTAPLEPL